MIIETNPFSGQGGSNPYELPSYYESGSLGTPTDTMPGYGLQDIESLYGGFQNIYDAYESMYGSPGAAEAQAATRAQFGLDIEYDPLKMEGDIRDQHKLDYKSYKQSLTDLLETSRGEARSMRRKVGKAGFAGGGAGSREAALIPQRAGLATQAARKGWEATQLGHTGAVYDERKKYRDDLWDRYQRFSTAAQFGDYMGADPSEFNPNMTMSEATGGEYGSLAEMLEGLW